VTDTSPQKGKPTPEENITIEFSGVKVKMPRAGLTLEALEELVFDIAMGIGRKAMQEALAGYDEKLRGERAHGILKQVSVKIKYLQTRVGEIRYRRRLYKEKGTGKPRYLLDEALKVGKNQRMSLKVSQVFGALASVEAYRGVAEQVSQLIGITYSHEAIRQNVIKEGLRIEEQEARGLEKVKLLDYKLPEEIPEVVYTETDATYIRKQNRGKKKAKKRHLEVKIGINYTGKESRYETGRKDSRKLIRKSIYTGIKIGRNKFLENLSYLSERDYGLSAVKKSYFGGDGDRWIRTGKDEYFPLAEYLLCPYHLFRRLREALPGRKEQQHRIKMLFEQNKVTEALEVIKEIRDKELDGQAQELISEYAVYVKNNRDGIAASMRLRIDKGQRGAGAVEANIDKTIVHRFKRRGMSWSERGASALLKVRQVIANGEWDNWWYKNRDQKIEIKAIFKEPLTAKESCKRQDVMPYIEATLPCYRGPDQGKPWVGVLRELTRANLLN